MYLGCMVLSSVVDVSASSKPLFRGLTLVAVCCRRFGYAEVDSSALICYIFFSFFWLFGFASAILVLLAVGVHHRFVPALLFSDLPFFVFVLSVCLWFEVFVYRSPDNAGTHYTTGLKLKR